MTFWTGRLKHRQRSKKQAKKDYTELKSSCSAKGTRSNREAKGPGPSSEAKPACEEIHLVHFAPPVPYSPAKRSTKIQRIYWWCPLHLQSTPYFELFKSKLENLTMFLPLIRRSLYSHWTNRVIRKQKDCVNSNKNNPQSSYCFVLYGVALQDALYSQRSLTESDQSLSWGLLLLTAVPPEPALNVLSYNQPCYLCPLPQHACFSSNTVSLFAQSVHMLSCFLNSRSGKFFSVFNSYISFISIEQGKLYKLASSAILTPPTYTIFAWLENNIFPPIIHISTLLNRDTFYNWTIYLII